MLDFNLTNISRRNQRKLTRELTNMMPHPPKKHKDYPALPEEPDFTRLYSMESHHISCLLRRLSATCAPQACGGSTYAHKSSVCVVPISDSDGVEGSAPPRNYAVFAGDYKGVITVWVVSQKMLQHVGLTEMQRKGSGSKRGVRFARVNVKWHDVMISNKQACIAEKGAPAPLHIYPVVQWQAHGDIITDISHIGSNKSVNSQSNDSDSQDEAVLQATKSPVLMTASSDGLSKMWCMKTGQFLGALDVYASHSKPKKTSSSRKNENESMNQHSLAPAWTFPDDTDGRLSAQRKEAVEVMSGVPMDEHEGDHAFKKEMVVPHHPKKFHQDPGTTLGLGNRSVSSPAHL